MKATDIAGAGVIVLLGYLIWRNIDKLTEGFGAWGIGPGAPERPPETPWFVPPSIAPYLPPEGVPPEQLPDIMPIPPPSLPELIFPPLAFLPDEPQEVPYMPTPPPPPSLPELIFPPLAIIRPIISPGPTPSPPYQPTVPPVYQPGSIIPSDPSHPATDPWLGGR